MARYYCDYCDSRCSNNSSSVRKQHNEGNLHRRNVYAFYAQFIGKDVQDKVDDIVAGFEDRVARGLVVPTYRTFPLQPVGFEEVGVGGEEGSTVEGGTAEGAVGSESVVVDTGEKDGVENDGGVEKKSVGVEEAVGKESAGAKASVGERSGSESESESESGSESGSGSGGIGGGDDDVASDDFVVKEITPAAAVAADSTGGAGGVDGDDGRADDRPAKRARVSEGGDGKQDEVGEKDAVEKEDVADTVPAGEGGEAEKVAEAADVLPIAGTEVAGGNDGDDDSDMEMD